MALLIYFCKEINALDFFPHKSQTDWIYKVDAKNIL